jgi:hypothetical protein
MSSTTSRGNYYKRKTKKHYEKLGYTVQLTEFTCGLMIGGRCIYKKIDIFGSDGIAMNGKEIIFWNSKHIGKEGEFKKINEQGQIRNAKKEFAEFPFPKYVKLHIVMWKPRKQPEIHIC